MVQREKGAVLITGTSTGVGRAAAILLEKQGYQVFATVRQAKDAESLRQEYKSGSLTPILMDVTKAEEIKFAADIVSKSVGDRGLVGLVNNAGLLVDGPIEYISIDDLKWQFEVNVFGQIAVTQAFLPLIRKAKGRIVNIGSIGGKMTFPFSSALCASKFALESFTDALRMELEPWGIEVILVEPGSIASAAPDKVEESFQKNFANMSPEAKAMYGDAYKFFVEGLIKSNRIGMPSEQVAGAILEALEASKPKTRYFLSKDQISLVLNLMLKKFIPDRSFDAMILKGWKLKNQN
ncbi:MAG: SDR family oxidoreductase [Nostoc sp. DedSLP03]|uniref:SDR family oxidoreductase n=1 Tax=Nostoc sp. DedSLP03 TaxID=3075400 RepID=UPI002AD31109|nr:SDR family oxidoreductase [Nostoc sp. DedSLP03]MDZ7966944.1 SDR family oxidoreductase [Nostoc sp. DedSLP03]